MPISSDTITELVQTYFENELAHRPVKQVVTIAPEITPADAYQVQAAVVAGWEQRGYRVVGRKGAATSPAAQVKMQVDEPIYGHLFDFHQAQPGDSLSTAHFIQPLIEGELAFRFNQRLAGPGVTVDVVLAATQSIVAAYDIIDFRTTDWQVGFGEALCYNVFTRHFVLGDQPLPPDQLDLPNVTIDLYKNGQLVTSATGSAVLGHPARSMAWLANKLAEQDRAILPGDFVLTGAITTPQPIAAGDFFEADFGPLGKLPIQFV
jgi:2-keto-4-pentenoate hydratase